MLPACATKRASNTADVRLSVITYMHNTNFIEHDVTCICSQDSKTASNSIGPWNMVLATCVVKTASRPTSMTMTMTMINTTQHNTQHNTTQHNTTQHNTTQQSPAQPSPAQPRTTQQTTTQHRLQHTCASVSSPFDRRTSTNRCRLQRIYVSETSHSDRQTEGIRPTGAGCSTLVHLGIPLLTGVGHHQTGAGCSTFK